MSSQHRKSKFWLIFFLYQSLKLWHLHPLGGEDRFSYLPNQVVPLPPGLSWVGLPWSRTAFRVLFAVSGRELNWKYARQEGHWSSHPSIKKSEDGTICSTPPTEDRVLSTPSDRTHWIPLRAHAVDTTAHGWEEDHLLSPVLFISEDTFPKATERGFCHILTDRGESVSFLTQSPGRREKPSRLA